tara:strand:- start:266 stop:469 length:204 start_codon:yes stop_codon:yes gene_type:complete
MLEVQTQAQQVVKVEMVGLVVEVVMVMEVPLLEVMAQQDKEMQEEIVTLPLVAEVVAEVKAVLVPCQ